MVLNFRVLHTKFQCPNNKATIVSNHSLWRINYKRVRQEKLTELQRQKSHYHCPTSSTTPKRIVKAEISRTDQNCLALVTTIQKTFVICDLNPYRRIIIMYKIN
jgi:hypothetical protein